ncbi:hypothetical protein PCANC_09286 [Puccinia coronata f. sp. avenae]|uniref:Uncharacterized protein n=1 Tax=Puccinia coronata f. sp. avenae TaxID=200324 RepID=A0A2N5UUM7_9BASI|nr:hypothetical protein PCANC_09286 [Puccinia coronata f. sp. avenae]PLW41458.1 hypothetical protein PCASD_07199 [Puccinia coronata f. sp. avenae]
MTRITNYNRQAVKPMSLYADRWPKRQPVAIEDKLRNRPSGKVELGGLASASAESCWNQATQPRASHLRGHTALNALMAGVPSTQLAINSGPLIACYPPILHHLLEYNLSTATVIAYTTRITCSVLLGSHYYPIIDRSLLSFVAATKPVPFFNQACPCPAAKIINLPTILLNLSTLPCSL